MNLTPPDVLVCIEPGCYKEATTDLGYCDEHYLTNVIYLEDLNDD
jgi:hypothetical protein